MIRNLFSSSWGASELNLWRMRESKLAVHAHNNTMTFSSLRLRASRSILTTGSLYDFLVSVSLPASSRTLTSTSHVNETERTKLTTCLETFETAEASEIPRTKTWMLTAELMTTSPLQCSTSARDSSASSVTESKHTFSKPLLSSRSISNYLEKISRQKLRMPLSLSSPSLANLSISTRATPPPPDIPENDQENLTPSSQISWTMGAAEQPVPVPATSKKASSTDTRDLEDKPLSLWPGMYHSPVTAALWQARASLRERDGKQGVTQQKLVPKTPEMSRTRVLYGFSRDEILREQYRNPWNGCRIGKLLEDLDALAGTIAMKHCSDDDHTTRPLLLVTASVDKISMKKPLNLEMDLKMKGDVAWVGRSSMEIRMEVIQPVRETTLKEDIALIANFTFVARDSETKKASPVNPLIPKSEEEKHLYAEGEARDEHRKQHRKKQQQGKIDMLKVEQDTQRLKDLLSEGRILCDMPALADRDTMLISDTRLENAIICQPQQRNMHGRIFGGFLMRRAYELAFSTCYVFGGIRPFFLEVDHVDFRKPVDVGNLLRFKACVLYTESERADRPLIHVEVVAYVTQPELKSSEVSNTFHFTFSLDPQFLKESSTPVRRVLPATEEEARGYLARYDADHLVKHPTFTR